MRAFMKSAVVAWLAIGATMTLQSQNAGQKVGDVTEDRVVAETEKGENWLVDGGSFGQRHYSALKQINDKNVTNLGLAWATDLRSPMGMASEPIVVDGVIYVVGSHSLVYALDAATGKIQWSFDPHVRVDCWRCSWSVRTTRGLAVYAGKVYVGTGDCRLVAIDAASGKQLWESQVCDPQQTGITGAPHVAKGASGKGIIFIGYYGGDTGVRGSIPAFDAETGKELWRFWTVPGDPAKGFESKALEMAAKTWTGDQWWKIAAAADWDPITYDNVTGLIYIGTSQSTPGHLFGDLAGYPVGGDRLFSGCTVAIRASDGEYVWHYQTKPKAEVFHIVVTDLSFNGAKRRVAMVVPRNGNFEVLDAKTGELISVKRLDDKMSHVPAPPLPPGSPRPGPNTPEPGSGHTWIHMGFSPLTGLAYIPAYDIRSTPLPAGDTYHKTRLVGKLFAWDPVVQSARWSVEQDIKVSGGPTVTAGNLVFHGQGTGEFDAYAADTGRKLWSIQTGSAIQSHPATFSLNGEQYVVIPVGFGSASRNFDRGSHLGTPESKRGPNRLLAFKLGAKTPFPTPHVVVPPVPKPPVQKATQAVVKKGEPLYVDWYCQECHSPEADGSGAWTEGGQIPDLRYMPAEVHRRWNQVVMWGSHARQGMPGFGNPPGFPLIKKKMTQEEADAIYAYVLDLQWRAYREDQAKR